MDALVINNLSVRFAGSETAAVNHCSLTLKTSNTHCLIGQSGSGKSTVGLATLQLLDNAQVSGSVHFAGRDLLQMPFAHMCALRGKEIGLIFQEPMQAANPLHKVRTLFTNALSAHYGRVSKHLLQATLERLLPQVGLALEHQNAFPHQLSGGQLQRVMIALSLVHSPSLLIADEPTTALDTVSQKNILDLLKRLQQDYQLTLLFITHDMAIVRYMADYVHVIDEGVMVEQGSAHDVIQHPASDYTKTLLAASEHRFMQPSTTAQKTLLVGKDLAVRVARRTVRWWQKKSFNTILSPTSFALQEGKSLGVIGASGSGKTTLGKACLRLLSASGQLLFDGTDLYMLKNKQLRALRPRLQPVLQGLSSALNPRKNVYHTIAEGLYIHNANLPKAQRMSNAAIEQRVYDIVRQVGLPEAIGTRYPHQCSGGQKQRISIARSLIVRPQLMVLDEPTSALDTVTQQEILLLLERLQAQNHIAYIVITHDFSVIRRLCHQVMVLDAGKVVEQGAVATIMQQPQHPATQLLLEAELR